MKGRIAAAVFATLLSAAVCEYDATSDEFIDAINAKATTWTAKRNFINYTDEQLTILAGNVYYSNKTFPTVFHDVDLEDIPGSFDSRSVWPECGSISTIRNQGRCGSCWAFAAVEVMSDRLCIFTAGAKQFVFSPEEVVSCCSAAGGCGGGGPDEAFQFWQDHGVPSGGDEGSNLGCRPYTAASTGRTPNCNERCVGGYNRDWHSDIRHGTASFRVTSSVEQIQHEIVINGPVTAGMQVYEDFFSYSRGVYQHTSGDLKGLHAIKILGWGDDNGTPYWLVANSWGTGWGEGGFFRILRGSNHVNIEQDIFAGNPNTNE